VRVRGARVPRSAMSSTAAPRAVTSKRKPPGPFRDRTASSPVPAPENWLGKQTGASVSLARSRAGG